MKKFLIILAALGLTLMPFALYGQSVQVASNSPPPVSQQLVPEGDFAMKLAPALKLGTPSSEAQAEEMLSSVGIAPKNGWIADYPVTPIIVGELQDTIAAAADANKLSMGKDDALKSFQGLTSEFGLAITPGAPGQYAENQPEVDPSVINNYYYDEGPPVVTYYAPPWDYYYLYAWVPYPFWWGGFFFTGFFCLNDFHRDIFFDGHHHFVSNHFVDPKTHAVFHVDPTTRTMGMRFNSSVARTQGFRSPETRRAAGSILNRSFATNRGMASRVGNAGRQNGMSRSFTAPNVTPHRSFSSPSGNAGRSFNSQHQSFGSAPSFSEPRSFSGSRSFGGFSGGHSFGGFSGGGFRAGGGGFGGGFHGGRR